MKIFISLIICFFISNVSATLITSSSVSTGSNFHAGTAYDASTNKYYRRSFYGNFSEFDDLASFDSNSPSRTFSLSTLTHGSYFEVKNGVVYSRTSNSNTSVASFDVTDGSIIDTAVMPNVQGSNGSSGGFQWGGYSSVNFMADGDDLYNLGRDGSDWFLTSLNDDLTVKSSINTGITSQLGYAFVMNGNLFTAPSYYANSIDGKYNILADTYESVSFSLSSLVGSIYMTNYDYVAETDTLYASNYYGSRHAVQNASTQFGAESAEIFGAESAEIPEPSVIALMGLGVFGLGLFRRKMK
jgi:hypothetical protein